jgi:hypothetical protein
MFLWQANLGRGVSTETFTRNLQRVLDHGEDAVIALQEIDEADRPEERAILVDLSAKTHRIIGKRTSVPILVPRYIEVLEKRVTPACDGLALYTPNRVVTEAVLRLHSKLDVAVLNTHLPLDRPATETRRAEVRRVLRERCQDQHRQGRGGIWIADTNTRTGWPRIAPREHEVTEAGIDRARAWAPPGRRVVVMQRQTVHLGIDGHDAHGARVLWHAA